MKRRSIFILGATLLIVLMTASSVVMGCAEVEEVEKATRPEWKVGYRWSYEIKHSAYNKVFETEEEVIAKEKFEEVLCYLERVSWGELNKPHSVTSEAYVTEDLNQKTVYKIEKGSRYLSREFIPEQRIFNWPLEVGKEWEADYRVKQKGKKGYMKSRIQGIFKVEEIEKIKVPAGEFQTFKITLRVRQGRELAVVQEWWYSPELYNVVRGKKYWPGGHVEEYQLLDYQLLDLIRNP